MGFVDFSSSTCMVLRRPPTGGTASTAALLQTWDSLQAWPAPVCFVIPREVLPALCTETTLRPRDPRISWTGSWGSSERSTSLKREPGLGQGRLTTKRRVYSTDSYGGQRKALSMKQTLDKPRGSCVI